MAATKTDLRRELCRPYEFETRVGPRSEDDHRYIGSAVLAMASSHTPFAVINRTVNPLLRAVLRSPAHGLLSRRVVLITVTGRRSGRTFTFPVQYSRQGERVTHHGGLARAQALVAQPRRRRARGAGATRRPAHRNRAGARRRANRRHCRGGTRRRSHQPRVRVVTGRAHGPREIPRVRCRAWSGGPVLGSDFAGILLGARRRFCLPTSADVDDAELRYRLDEPLEGELAGRLGLDEMLISANTRLVTRI